jgi:hypothetical protein
VESQTGIVVLLGALGLSLGVTYNAPIKRRSKGHKAKTGWAAAPLLKAHAERKFSQPNG